MFNPTSSKNSTPPQPLPGESNWAQSLVGDSPRDLSKALPSANRLVNLELPRTESETNTKIVHTVSLPPGEHLPPLIELARGKEFATTLTRPEKATNRANLWMERNEIPAEKHMALTYLAATEHKGFAELVLELRSRAPETIRDESLLKIAVWRDPKAFLERFERFPRDSSHDYLLSLALLRCDEASYREFLKSHEGSKQHFDWNARAARSFTLKMAELGRDPTTSCEKILSQLQTSLSPSQQLIIIDHLSLRKGAIDFVLDTPEGKRLPASLKIPLIERIFQVQGDAAERRLPDLLKIPGFETLLPDLARTSIAPRAADEFDRKMKEVFPQLTPQAMNIIGCALADRDEKAAKLIVQNPEVFRYYPDTFLHLAAEHPKVFLASLEALRSTF